MNWVIQCKSKKKSHLYWNNNEGWVATSLVSPDSLKEYAEIYTDKEKELNNLPIDGKWVQYNGLKGELNERLF